MLQFTSQALKQDITRCLKASAFILAGILL